MRDSSCSMGNVDRTGNMAGGVFGPRANIDELNGVFVRDVIIKCGL